MEQQKCISQNIIYYGHLEYDEYVKYMERADVAIGTLALHRKGMNEASPLKVREYLAHGIPVIIGYDDTDFPCNVSFILRISNDEKNTIKEADAINEFVLDWRGKRINRKEILAIDNKGKEKERTKFFEAVLARQLNIDC
jgi:glycosyltransferase involved in cell wall biosynthesis